jgi:hypothetical protein
LPVRVRLDPQETGRIPARKRRPVRLGLALAVSQPTYLVIIDYSKRKNSALFLDITLYFITYLLLAKRVRRVENAM